VWQARAKEQQERPLFGLKQGSSVAGTGDGTAGAAAVWFLDCEEHKSCEHVRGELLERPLEALQTGEEVFVSTECSGRPA
jgi:hypothetical protein